MGAKSPDGILVTYLQSPPSPLSCPTRAKARLALALAYGRGRLAIARPLQGLRRGLGLFGGLDSL